MELVKADIACDWNVKYYSVIGSGKAYFVKGLEEKRRAMDIIIEHYSDKSYQYSEDKLKKAAIIKVEIENISAKKAGY